MSQNEASDEDKVDRVNCVCAVLHPESRQKEAQSDQMAANAEELVKAFELVSLPVCVLIIFGRDHRVNDQAEGQEHTVLSEQKDDENA